MKRPKNIIGKTNYKKMKKHENDTNEKKVCKYCKNKKLLSEFNKNKSTKDGYQRHCRVCNKQYKKDYYLKNSEKIKEEVFLWRSKKENKEKRNKWDRDNKVSIMKRQKEYYYNKYNNDIKYKISHLLRSRFYKVVNNNIKILSSLKLLGCTIEEFRLYLENLFLPEFTWGNYGIVWEIDHKEACANFDLTKLEEQQKCFHYTNLQPLFKTTAIAESFGYIDKIGNRNKGKR